MVVQLFTAQGIYKWGLKLKLGTLEVFPLRGRGPVAGQILKILPTLEHAQDLHAPVLQSNIYLGTIMACADVINVPGQLTIKYRYYLSGPDLITWPL